MTYGIAALDLAAPRPQLEARVARALADELYCDGYQADIRWSVDLENPNVLTDSFRALTVYVDSDQQGPRVRLIGTLHADIYDGIPENSRYHFRPPLVRASVALERGAVILAREARRRVLAKLDGLIVSVRDAVARERARAAAVTAARARLEPTFGPDGRIYRERDSGAIYGSVSVNALANHATFNLTVPLDVAEKIAALIEGQN
jgi:hypothetical protein